jgi:Holliday junction resolvase RusA-like endonuclease
MIKFTIPLCPRTKKNSGRIVHNGRYHKLLPSEAFEQYQNDAGWYIPNRGLKINYPINVKALYYMQTRGIVDLNGLNQGLHDVLVHYGVLKDDNSRIIVGTDGSKVLYDKENPRTEIEISEVNHENL